jgi:hypothetical protein
MGNIRIVKPAGRGSYICNYKDYGSIVLLAVVNAKCDFICMNVSYN